MNLNLEKPHQQGFTLIELLIVIAILAVLATTVTLVLNPTELIKQARDSTRLADLNNINKALSLYETDQISGDLGTSQTVYTSLPDSNSDCSSYSLPSLPSGWSYNCVSSASSTAVDGTGWIPVDFSSMSISSPLSRLPVDPINSATSSLYYTYVPGGSYEVTAILESDNYKMGGDKDKASNDGGDFPEVYELGSNLTLDPVNRDPDLVGYWRFDEGSGTTAYDSSGNGNDGIFSGSPTWTTDVAVGDYALSFDGVDDYVYSVVGNLPNEYSISLWVKTSQTSEQSISGFSDDHPTDGTHEKEFYTDSNGKVIFRGYQQSPSSAKIVSSDFFISDSNFHYITAVAKNNDVVSIYVDGDKKAEKSIGTLYKKYDTGYYTIGIDSEPEIYFDGKIDEVRIYNKALSSSEVRALYDSER